MRTIFMKSRVLFILAGCHFCRIYAEVIGIINSKLPTEKKIKVIDCTKYHDYNIIDNPLIEIYMPHINGQYPVLFLEGGRVDGTHTREELLAWLNARFAEEFVIPEGNKHMFNKECSWVNNKYFGKKVVCK